MCCLSLYPNIPWRVINPRFIDDLTDCRCLLADKWSREVYKDEALPQMAQQM